MSSAVACLQAVEFVQLQRDDDLWEQLIALTLGDAQLTGGCPCMVFCRWRVAGLQALNYPLTAWLAAAPAPRPLPHLLGPAGSGATRWPRLPVLCVCVCV